jgi:hypothetical protein
VDKRPFLTPYTPAPKPDLVLFHLTNSEGAHILCNLCFGTLLTAGCLYPEESEAEGGPLRLSSFTAVCFANAAHLAGTCDHCDKPGRVQRRPDHA